jgi:DNA-binding MarR family transcriptional regulator
VKLRRAERQYRLTTRDYGQLAAFRHALRAFLRFSDAAAAEIGLSARHYQAMLVLRACADERRLSIADLADQLLIKHNSAVGRVDRLEREALSARPASRVDRRKVELRLTPRGRTVLAALAAAHRRELQRMGVVLEAFLAEVPVQRTAAAGRRAQAGPGVASRRG